MSDPKNLSIKNYSYHLPEDCIPKYPLAERDASKLLIYEAGRITEDIYRNLSDHLAAKSLLLFNDTKVIQARLFFQKATGGVIEVFCLEPHEQYSDIASAMSQRNRVLWQCLIGGASKWKHGQVLEKKIKSSGKQITLEARFIAKETDCFVIEFSWNPAELSFAEILHAAGAIPLPPYIKREAEQSDATRYQTVYAHYEGSVAAPTAGLHFTDSLLKKIKAKNIQTDFLTLHVGAGTFKPVKTETLAMHEMHGEFITVSKTTIKNILLNLSQNIIPVGTTSLRAVESLYWLGAKIHLGFITDENQISIDQWEAYDLEHDHVAPFDALQSLIDFLVNKHLEQVTMRTQILIAPSYKAKIANALITNFHQPQSTLLLLVAALIGDDWQKVYAYALRNHFRFLSYGDGCLLWFNRAKA
jgi:S-adenosylmethionine:tRNA ribosyltransferase-isomerase